MPGAINAWETLLKAHGRKGLDELLQPAIRFAADGWPVHPKVAWDWKRLEAKLRKNGTHAFLPNGAAPNAGDIFRQPALAETLRAIARHGAKAFYEGPVAADIVATLRARGGLHTEEDFAAGLHQRRVRRADHAELARLRRVPVPAQRPGHHRADDPGHARRLAIRRRRAARRAALSTATSRRRGWPIATATPSSPIRRRSMCR